MPEVLGSPPSPRVALFWNGAAWQWALVDAAGNLQIDVVDAAGLQNALQSVATDRLIVRGEDQLFSYAGALLKRKLSIISGAGGYADSDTVPAGQIWVVTTVASIDMTSPTTEHAPHVRRGAIVYNLGRDTQAFGAGEAGFYHGMLWLDPDDLVRVYFIGGLANDNCRVFLIGHIMTLET